jgi:hypothetical protein
MPAFGNVNGASPTPLVTWDEPQIGSPDYYLVDLIDLRDGRIASWLQTTRRSIRLPPRTDNSPYALRILAVSQPCIDPLRQLYRTYVPSSSADVLTGAISRW